MRLFSHFPASLWVHFQHSGHASSPQNFNHQRKKKNMCPLLELLDDEESASVPNCVCAFSHAMRWRKKSLGNRKPKAARWIILWWVWLLSVIRGPSSSAGRKITGHQSVRVPTRKSRTENIPPPCRACPGEHQIHHKDPEMSETEWWTQARKLVAKLERCANASWPWKRNAECLPQIVHAGVENNSGPVIFYGVQQHLTGEN